ncbi:hypothetical protein [Halalkalicoccus sp. NIPERK01]|uniref:hypothetical protein n=1 Tax=Halalkalicoccus sp. NIPERK01 TaxID=3053469 RepID=UPI00256F05FD|nr:hypothetical protein [Halalkalicoccus sp. NIPERK01]MDL5362733.1 hypothetical protein [Halalkalicoccus sp. NIPERK01]
MAGSPGGVYGWLSTQRFDVIGAILALVLAVALLPLRLLASNFYIVAIPVTMAVASALYLLAVRTSNTEGLPAFPVWAGRLLPSLTLLGTALLIVLGLYQGGRTPAFYTLATVVGAAIFLQIFFTRERDFVPPLVLFEILAFAFTIRYVALLTTPGYIGIDVWTHVPSWSAAIAETGSLDFLEGNKYYASPLFHLSVVATSLLADVSVRNGLFLSVGFGMAFSAVFLYIATRLFVSARWSLFAVAVYAMSAHTVEWSIHLIPTGLGLVFFLGVFYLLVRVLDVTPGSREFVLIVLLSIATILTHQISAFIMLVLTGAGLLAHLLLRFELFAPPSRFRGVTPGSGDSVSLTGLLAFDLGFITFMWSLTPYHGDTFLATTFSFFRVTLEESAGLGDITSERGATAATDPTLLEQAIQYIDAAVFLLVFLVAVVGCFYVLRRRNISHAAVMCGASIVVMLVFIFGFPMFGIRTFIPQRWYAFLAAPMALLGAVGLAYLARRLTTPVVLVVLLVFALAFPMVAFAATDGTLDNPRFEGAQTKYSYNEAELNAVETIGEIRPVAEEEGETYNTDHPYNTVFSRSGPGPAVAANITDEGLRNTDTLIYRDYQSTGGAFFVSENDRSVTPEMSRSELCGGERHYAYDNGDVTMCTATWEVDTDADTGTDLDGGETDT